MSESPDRPAAGWLDLLRQAPGMGAGRRRDEVLAPMAEHREWMADRLEQGKLGLERYSRVLVDAVLLDPIVQVDRLRGQVDTLIGRLRGADAGGRFAAGEDGLVVLERLAEMEAALGESVAVAADAMEALGEQPDDAGARLAGIATKLSALADAWDEREDLLRP
ncbi:MAG: hypothetical protein AAGJ46_04890 [Planctomycetota bacterium]